MESVFVTENPIDINLFVNECNDVQKLKIGEIFQLRDNSLSMCCMHCSQEFQYFTEFSIHIEEHFLRGEVAQFKEITDEFTKSDGHSTENVSMQTKSGDRMELNEDGVKSEFFNNDIDLDDYWSEDEFGDANRGIFEPEINVESFENQSETCKLAEGTDYQKVNGKFRCLNCSHETIRWDHFRDHMLTHANTQNIFCPICSKAFSAISYVRKHVNRTHKLKITADKIREAQPSFSATSIVAPVQQIETKSFVEGEDYEKINGRFKCLTCGRKMLDHVKEHLLTHSNDKDVFCPICEKSFIAVSYVRKHVNRAHKMKITAEEIKTAQSSFQVEHRKTTSQNNATRVSLIQNRIENVEKHFECFDCHRQFRSLSSLRIHLKLHSGIKYACPHCDKIFAMRSYVRDHIVAMHGIKREEIPKDSIRQASSLLSSEPQPSVSLFECNLCKNQYTKRQNLTQHMRTHTSGPFLCVICGAVYKSIANLRYHMERHQADPNKRHKCTDCGKTYPTRRYMLSHYRTIHLNKKKKKPKKDKGSNNNETQTTNIQPT